MKWDIRASFDKLARPLSSRYSEPLSWTRLCSIGCVKEVIQIKWQSALSLVPPFLIDESFCKKPIEKVSHNQWSKTLSLLTGFFVNLPFSIKCLSSLLTATSKQRTLSYRTIHSAHHLSSKVLALLSLLTHSHGHTPWLILFSLTTADTTQLAGFPSYW